MRVGVVYGGRSGEHEVSLASAAAVVANLDRQRYEPVPIRIEKDGRWTLPDRPPTAASAAETIEAGRAESARAVRPAREVHVIAWPGDETILTFDRTGDKENEGVRVTGLGLDVIFPVLHGPYGEDGTVQGLLELANIPYVGAGVLASSVGMDKALAKVVFSAHGLPVAEGTVVKRREWLAAPDAIVERVGRTLGYPLFVKPANLGSSVGISKARDEESLHAAIALAADFDRKILVEAAIPDAREIEVAVVGNDEPEASVPGEIVPSREFYDYEAKYLDDNSKLIIPAAMDGAAADAIRDLAVRAYAAIDCAGMARVDFLVGRDTGLVVLNEINTIPGFTTISMYAKLWEASGLAYPQLLDRLIALALERHQEKQHLRTSVG